AAPGVVAAARAEADDHGDVLAGEARRLRGGRQGRSGRERDCGAGRNGKHADAIGHTSRLLTRMGSPRVPGPLPSWSKAAWAPRTVRRGAWPRPLPGRPAALKRRF